jgi:hypothetical protein
MGIREGGSSASKLTLSIDIHPIFSTFGASVIRFDHGKKVAIERIKRQGHGDPALVTSDEGIAG